MAKLLILSSSLLLLLCSQLEAAPSIAANCVNNALTSVTTGSCTIAPSGSNRLLYANLHCDSDPGAISSATFNTSETLTSRQVTTIRRFSNTFSLTAPSATSASISITWTNSATCLLTGIALQDVDQTTPDDGPDADSRGVSAAPANTVSSASGDLVIDFVVLNNDDGLISTTGDNTEYLDETNSNTLTTGVSTAPGAATVTMSWTTDFENWELVAFNVNAAAGGGGGANSNNLSLLGVQ